MQGLKTIFRSSIVLLSIFSCLAQHDLSQTTNQLCNLTLRDSPAPAGYRLSMNIADVDQNKISRKAARYNENYIKAEFDDSTYYLTFENEKLRLITVQYKSLRFANLDAFVSYLNESMHLPDLWQKQTPEQIEIEKQMPELDEQLATLTALRALMLQIHGRNCGHAKRLDKEIPKMLAKIVGLEEKRQIGSRLSCKGFSIIAFIDNSIEQGVPSIHLFLPEKGNEIRLKP